VFPTSLTCKTWQTFIILKLSKLEAIFFIQMKKRANLIIFLCSFYCCSFCLQAIAQKDYFVINYTAKNGLLQNSITGLMLDQQGYLWLSSENGIVRFDGNRFRAFGNEGVPLNLFGIVKTIEGKLYTYDSQNGFYGIENNKLTIERKNTPNILNYLDTKGIIPSKEFFIDNSTPSSATARKNGWFYPQLTLFTKSKDEFYVRTNIGIAHYKKGILKKQMSLIEYHPVSFLQIENGIYFFDNRNQLYYLDTQKWEIQKCKIAGDIVKNRLLAKSKIDGEYWNYNSSEACVQINYSLFSLKQSSNPILVYSYLITDQLPHNSVVSSLIYSAANHFIAVATDNKGLFIFKEKAFKTITSKEPEPGTNNAYYFQVAIDSNTIYSDWSREFSITGVKKSMLPIVREYSDPLFHDSKGNYWYMNNNQPIRYNPKEEKPSVIHTKGKTVVLCFYEYSDTLFIGMSNGIGYIKNDSIFYIANFEFQGPYSNVFLLLKNTPNEIWFANYAGVFILNLSSGKVKTYTPVYQKVPYTIYSIFDYILIGTYGQGCYMYKDGKTVKMPLDKNNCLNNINGIYQDKNNFVWISSNHGILKTTAKQLINYFNDTTSSVFYFQYNEEDGIENSEFNGGNASSCIKLKSGYVSFTSMDGLVWFKPETVYDASLNSPLLLDAVYIDNIAYLPEQVRSIPSTAQTLGFDFNTCYWGNNKNLILEYRLEGFNKKWIPLINEQSKIEFSNLHSGNYTLLIRKHAGIAENRYTELKFPFSVEKQFYEEYWFILMCLLLIAWFIIAIARIYASNIKKRNIALEKNVQERTLELSKVNTELLQSISLKDKLISIISHDIVTPLRFITMVASKGSNKRSILEKEKIQEALFDIKNTSIKLHDNAQNILNWIKYQNRRLEATITNVPVGALTEDVAEMFSEIAENKNTKIINHISHDDIVRTDKNILSIILHNLISNAVKFTASGTIKIEGKQILNHYQIKIDDNGQGMNKEQLLRLQKILNNEEVASINVSSGEKGNGLGFIIIAELIKLINGTINIESTQMQGTKITILLKTE
jgi:signal transduction histidine kinase